MSICWSCAEEVATGQRYHQRCLQELFGVERAPTIDVDLARLHTIALAMVGHVSISGVQRKLSVTLDNKRSTLRIAVGASNYLLKPQDHTFPSLPENEWVTQRIAALAGMDVPPSALLELRDHSLAYIVRRFDRTEDGAKLAMEDFCQLAQVSPADKYRGSAEQCSGLLRRYASEPLVESLRLYRQFVFTWWVGNGDLHLKNLALLRGHDKRWRLSPAYDQLNTRLVLPNDSLAIPMVGKRDNIKAKTLIELAKRMRIGPKAGERVRNELRETLPRAIERITTSPLPEEMRAQYCEQLEQRTQILVAHTL